MAGSTIKGKAQASVGLVAGLLLSAAGVTPIAMATDLNTCTPAVGFDSCRAFHFTGASETAYLTEDMVGKTVTIEVWGAGGGGSNYGWSSQSGGGGGGYIWAQYLVDQATELYVTVGEGGSSNDTNGTYGGGGAGGGGDWAGASGGGFTGVWTNFTGTFSTSTPLFIAAGGGGISPGTWQVSAGGAGGGATGGNAGTVEEHGQGATQSAGGAAATFTGNCSTAPQAGAAFQGGNGATSSDNREGGGGGGGGYFGGGGGRCQDNADGLQNGAGGGGSSFIATHPALISSTTFSGVNGYYDGDLGYGIGGASGGSASPAYLAGVGKGGDISVTAGASDGGDGMVVLQWNSTESVEPEPTSGPAITGAEPSTANAGDPVAVEGDDLGYASQVIIGGSEVPFEYNDDVLTIDTTGLEQGRHDITVVTPKGRATLTLGLTILNPESFWTKRVSESEVKIYAKHVVGIGKVTFHVDGREIAWVEARDGTDPKLRLANNAYYLVRTVKLHEGKNRFDIKLDGVRQRRATYVP